MLAPLALAVVAALAPAVDFENYTYRVTPCNPGAITTHAGQGEQFSDDKTQSFDAYVEQVVFGELAGRSFAVVRLSCSFPVGSSSAAYLYAINGHSATYLRTIATADPGEGHMMKGWIHIRFAHNLLYVDRCVSTDDCTHGIVTTYAMRAGKVAAVYEMNHKYTP